MRKLRLAAAGVACAALLAACATPVPVNIATPAAGSVVDQLRRGASLYAQNCATSACHGTQGEGLRADGSFRVWPLVGAEFQARNPNAQVVFDVVRSGDERNLRAMTDQQIYDAIAYELSLNDVRLDTPLVEQTAPYIPSGLGALNVAALNPPPDNVASLVPQIPPRTFFLTANGYIELRVDQVARARVIGNTSAPGSGSYIIMVIALRDLTDHSLNVDPKFLRLHTVRGDALEPQPIDLASPIERFHPQLIDAEHGTAAHVVFALSASAVYTRLVYDDQTGHPLSLNVSQ